MNGFRNSSRNGQVWRWQRTGHRAVNLEIRGFWMEAAEAWCQAAGIAPPGGLATICPATRRTMPKIWTEGINKEAGIFEIKFIKLTSDESLRWCFRNIKKQPPFLQGKEAE